MKTKGKSSLQALQIQPLTDDVLANLSIEELEERLEMQILHMTEAQLCYDCGSNCGSNCGTNCSSNSPTCGTNVCVANCSTNNICAADCPSNSICGADVPIIAV